MQTVSQQRFAVARTKSFTEQLPMGVMLVVAHILPLTLLWTGTRSRDWIAFLVFYVLICHAVGLALHRYFAHRSFKTSRAFQFLLAILACSIFGDPVWFAGKHRYHHRHSDTEDDVHTPLQGLWQCWIGSIFDNGHSKDEILDHSRDWSRWPELRWLSRYFYIPGAIVAMLVLVIGGYQMFVTGYCLAFLVALHGSSAVNFFCHKRGYRRFATADLSTNSILLGYLFFGEGWHNNHHRFPGSARSGFAWYELDLLYGSIMLLSWLGLVWDVRTFREAARRVPGLELALPAGFEEVAK